jgi:uncharacterized protein (DUF924 family)
MTSPPDVLDYWFGPPQDEAATLSAGMPRWFGGDPLIDSEIRDRFAADVDAARRGELSHWSGTAEGRLALLILLDQFGRHLHRQHAAAFAADLAAQQICLEGLRLGHDRQLDRPQRAFYYLPLEHAENLSLQHCSVALYAALHGEAPTRLDKPYRVFSDYAVKHREVIARYGRFPHRNRALGRNDTPAEVEYLAQPDAGF